MFYRLDGKNPAKCATGQEWAEWYEAAAKSGTRIVGHDEIGDITVSTIFTGIDPHPIEARPPQLFETMIFAGNRSTGVALLSATWDQAEQTHRVRVRDAENAELEDDDQ